MGYVFSFLARFDRGSFVFFRILSDFPRENFDIHSCEYRLSAQGVNNAFQVAWSNDPDAAVFHKSTSALIFC